MDALKYGDASQAAALHIEGTDQGFYCESERFTQVLAQARKRKSPEECDRLSAADPTELEVLDPQAQLLAQIVRFTCEYPDADCAGYGARVLASHLAERTDAAGYRWAVEGWKIKKILGDDAEAVVYVDLDGGEGGEVAHETLSMKKIDGEWYVSEPLDDQHEYLAQ